MFTGNPRRTNNLQKLVEKVIHDSDQKFLPLRQVFNELNILPQVPTQTLEYSQVYSSPWASNISLEERHEKIVHKISEWPTDSQSGDQRELDPVMTFLLAKVLILNSDSVQLKDEKRVSQFQVQYLNMLHRYLKYKDDKKANNRLGNGLMIASLARELNEIRSKRLPV